MRQPTLASVYLLAMLSSGPAAAEQLLTRRYTTREGLPDAAITAIHHDRFGYVWIATYNGVARFDGYRFVQYGTRDGLPHPMVTAVAEDRQGRIWVGTYAGVARLLDDPDARRPAERRFAAYSVGEGSQVNNVASMVVDRAGTLWCLTADGIHRSELSLDGVPRFARVLDAERALPPWKQPATFDRHGRLWFGITDRIAIYDAGRVHQIVPDPGAPVVGIAEAADGRMYVASSGRLLVLDNGVDGQPVVVRRHRIVLQAHESLLGLMPAGDNVWLGTTFGLIRWNATGQTRYNPIQQLPGTGAGVLARDREGNLWVGAGLEGLAVITADAVAGFTTADGLPPGLIRRVIEGHDRRIYVTTEFDGFYELSNGRAVLIPGTDRPPFSTARRRVLPDRAGDWWIGTSDGVFRFRGPRLNVTDGGRLAGTAGLPALEVFDGPGLHEDRQGRILVAMVGGHLYRWDRQSAAPRFVRAAPPAAIGVENPGTLFTDPAGVTWIASYDRLQRLTQGAPQRVALPPPVAPGEVRALFGDRRGRLWLGLRFHGVLFADAPAAPQPVFRRLSTDDGLASDTVRCICDDTDGRLYFGTARGVDRFDPATGETRHLGALDGLPNGVIVDCVRDHRGDLWFATGGGAARLTPNRLRVPAAAPPVYLTRIESSAGTVPIPERGVRRAPRWTFPAGVRNVAVEFVAITSTGERPLAYQYRLEGVDPAWSRPQQDRVVRYARLAPGSYRLLVRVAGRHEAGGVEPAAFPFDVHPPLWQRWWFLTLVIATCAASAGALHRARVRRLLAMERVRRQIATDLHDDVGAAVAQVALLSETLKRRLPEAEHARLDRIITLARGMRDSMADIVWAVDPRRDTLAALVERLREVAATFAQADGVEIVFAAPPDESLRGVALGPDQRRHLLFVFKEALANAARHARATRIEAMVEVEGGTLRLRVRDDGCGFDPACEPRGHGLANLRHRAQELDASLRVVSSPGGGTTVEVRAPLGQR